MRIWVEQGRVVLVREAGGHPHRVNPGAYEITIDGQKPPPVFEADDQEGWALVAAGEWRSVGPRVFGYQLDTLDPHGVKTEIRHGRVDIVKMATFGT